jgi:hypothetical protein
MENATGVISPFHNQSQNGSPSAISCDMAIFRQLPQPAWIHFGNDLPCDAMGTTSQAEHEHATVKAFVVRGRQERFLSFLASPKSRQKFTRELGHFRCLDL